MSRTLGLLALTFFAGLGFGCDGPAGSSSGADSCPPCECACECAGTGSSSGGAEGQAGAVAAGPDDAPTNPPTNPPARAGSNEISDLVAAASRAMAHGDGQTCLAKLDQVKALDASMESHMTLTRAQCRMLIGECQEAKQTVVEWYMREQAFTREFAERSAENLASMRCRGGDATDRDRLLAALFDLQDGAYMNKRDVAFCKDRVALIETLGPKVKPRDAEDTQVTGGLQALFHTSAMCFARAGDCKTAYTYYRRLFPPDALSALPDAKLRESTVRASFDSSIVLCQPSP